MTFLLSVQFLHIFLDKLFLKFTHSFLAPMRMNMAVKQAHVAEERDQNLIILRMAEEEGDDLKVKLRLCWLLDLEKG